MNIKVFFGWVFLVVGLAITILTGGCVVAVGNSSLLGPPSEAGWRLALMVGAIPFLMGLVILLGGYIMIRKDDAE